MAGSVSIPNDDFFRQVYRLVKAGHDVTILVVGRSMEPFLRDRRDMIMISSCPAGRPKRGDMVLARTDDGRYIAHRVMRVDSPYFTMRGDGNVLGEEKARISDVIGLVTAYRHCSKTTEKDNCTPETFHRMERSLPWKIYSFIWTEIMSRCFLLRRVVLAVWRHLLR